MNTISGGTTFGNIAAFVQNNHRAMLGQMSTVASGLNITRPADGAVDFFRGQTLGAQARQLDGIRREFQQASALLDVAEGSMAEIHNDLTSMRDLIRRYFSTNISDNEKTQISQQIEDLKMLVLHTVEHTVFGGRRLLEDSSANPLIKIRNNPNDITQTWTVSFTGNQIVDMSDFDFSTFATREDALDAINDKISQAANFMGHLAGTRFGLNAQYNLGTLKQNTSLEQKQNTLGANDIDEMMSLTRRQILQQGAVSMLTQGNVMRGSVLNLLRF
jgi:flagellin-like hook-associated protein FlgL